MPAALDFSHKCAHLWYNIAVLEGESPKGRYSSGTDCSGLATACEPTTFPPPNALINLQLQSDRRVKCEKFLIEDDTLQRSAIALPLFVFLRR